MLKGILVIGASAFLGWTFMDFIAWWNGGHTRVKPSPRTMMCQRGIPMFSAN